MEDFTNELTVVNDELVLSQQALELFEKARTLKETIDTLKKELDSIEKPFKEAFKQSGFKSYKGDTLTVTVIPDRTEKVLNEIAMKKDGVYDKYLTEVPKKGYVRVTYRKVGENGTK